MSRRKTHHRAGLALVTAAVLAGMGAAAADAAKTVRTVGGPEFQPNQYIRDTLRFAPGAITVRPNERVTWVDADRAPEPHTVTVVSRRNLPDRIEELFECRACALANQHLEDPNDPNSDVARVRVDVGRAGMNTEGDSLFLAPGGRISGRITAGVGSTVRYFCAIHPWMQGSIRVTRTGSPASGGAGLTGRHRH
jgi:plastocyanin